MLRLGRPFWAPTSPTRHSRLPASPCPVPCADTAGFSLPSTHLPFCSRHFTRRSARLSRPSPQLAHDSIRWGGHAAGCTAACSSRCRGPRWREVLCRGGAPTDPIVPLGGLAAAQAPLEQVKARLGEVAPAKRTLPARPERPIVPHIAARSLLGRQLRRARANPPDSRGPAPADLPTLASQPLPTPRPRDHGAQAGEEDQGGSRPRRRLALVPPAAHPAAGLGCRELAAAHTARSHCGVACMQSHAPSSCQSATPTWPCPHSCPAPLCRRPRPPVKPSTTRSWRRPSPSR